MNYLVADMLARLKNASAVFKESVSVPNSKLNRAILDVLKETGWIKDYKVSDDNRQIVVTLKYKKGKYPIPVIQNIKIYSKPGRRWYIKAKELPPTRSGYGIRIISTSQGVMSTDKARKLGIGGELICEIW